jgi:hypothetical protein
MGKREFKNALRYLGFNNVGRMEMRNLFNLADQNRSGKIDEREFCEFWVFMNNHQQPNWGQGLFILFDFIIIIHYYS